MYAAGWMLLGGLTYFYIQSSVVDEPLPRRFQGLLARWFISFYLLGAAIPFIILLSRKLPIDSQHWKQTVWVHLFTAVAFVFLHAQASELVLRLFFSNMVLRDFWLIRPGSRGWNFGGPWNLLRLLSPAFFVYWLGVSLSHLQQYYKRLQEGELQAIQLKSQLATAQLRALKNQLHPHFLFNTLHTLSSLIYQDVRAADKMIRQLSELLRITLATSDVLQVPLREEIEFLHLYLDIMKTRFRERLESTIELQPNTVDAQIPNLILQPLVENSIKHGLEGGVGTGKIRIIARAENSRLRIEISDNGPGFSVAPEQAMQTGRGLRNTRDRLQQLYGNDFRLDFESPPGGGLRVVLEVPLNYGKKPVDQNP